MKIYNSIDFSKSLKVSKLKLKVLFYSLFCTPPVFLTYAQSEAAVVWMLSKPQCCRGFGPMYSVYGHYVALSFSFHLGTIHIASLPMPEKGRLSYPCVTCYVWNGCHSIPPAKHQPAGTTARWEKKTEKDDVVLLSAMKYPVQQLKNLQNRYPTMQH